MDEAGQGLTPDGVHRPAGERDDIGITLRQICHGTDQAVRVYSGIQDLLDEKEPRLE